MHAQRHPKRKQFNDAVFADGDPLIIRGIAPRNDPPIIHQFAVVVETSTTKKVRVRVWQEVEQKWSSARTLQRQDIVRRAKLEEMPPFPG